MIAPSVPYFNSALSNTKVVLKTSTLELFDINVYNPNAADAYVQMFDALTANVTLGTTVPTHSYWIPALGALDKNFDRARVFNIGLVIAATTTVGGSTAPTTALVVNLGLR